MSKSGDVGLFHEQTPKIGAMIEERLNPGIIKNWSVELSVHLLTQKCKRQIVKLYVHECVEQALKLSGKLCMKLCMKLPV